MQRTFLSCFIGVVASSNQIVFCILGSDTLLLLLVDLFEESSPRFSVFSDSIELLPHFHKLVSILQDIFHDIARVHNIFYSRTLCWLSCSQTRARQKCFTGQFSMHSLQSRLRSGWKRYFSRLVYTDTLQRGLYRKVNALGCPVSPTHRMPPSTLPHLGRPERSLFQSASNRLHVQPVPPYQLPSPKFRSSRKCLLYSLN